MRRLFKGMPQLAPSPLAWAAIAIGLAAHFIGFFLFQIQLPELEPREDTEAYVTIVIPHQDSSDSGLLDRILLSDDSALFLPSVHDYGWQLMQPSAYLEDRETSLLRPVAYPVEANPSMIINALESDSSSVSVSNVFSLHLWDMFASLGEGERTVIPLPNRFGAFSFFGMDDLAPFLLLPVERQPQDLASFVSLWNPCEFLVLVGATGSVGEPLLRASSGFVAVDRFAAKWIASYCNRHLPEPGYYRVVFGP